MRIPIRNQQITIELERMAPRAVDRPELIEATDRDIERLARTGGVGREPRWDVPTLMLGLRP